MRPNARQSDLVIKQLGDELLIADLTRKNAQCLNRTAALVWQNCDGHKTVAEISGIVRREIHPALDEDVVWLALQQLSDQHLLDEQVVRPPAGITRRDAVRRIGRAGAALLPFIIGVSLPSAAKNESRCDPKLLNRTKKHKP